MIDPVAEALQDMVDHAREAIELLGGREVEELCGDRTVLLALERLIEIVGEAASRVDDETRARIELPWTSVVGMRNKVIHDCGNVDHAILVATVEGDLPMLIRRIAPILQVSFRF